MAFEKTPRGTYGPKAPAFAVPVMKFMGNQMIKRFRRSGTGKAAGLDCLVLTTVGAKSGQKRQALLAQIEVGGKTVNVTAAQLNGPDRDAAWQRILKAAPRYAGYEKKTDRVMPVIRLTPRIAAPEG